MVLGEIEVKRPSRTIRERNENIADTAKATAKVRRGFFKILVLMRISNLF
jgi:hypothetical protein